MTTYGRNVIGSTGFPIMAAAGEPEWKTGGITIDWSTVTAVNTDTTYPDQLLVKNGTKAFRFGQILAMITATGLYGPFDPAASDGRQTLARGSAFVLNESLLQTGLLGFAQTPTDHPGVFAGGRVWKDRLLATTGTHSLAAGPTFTELEAAMPRLVYVTN